MKLNNFIQFQPNQRLNQNAEIIYPDVICLKPFEWYCQVIDITLTDTDTVEVVDCDNNVLEDVIFYTSGLFCEFVIQNEYYQEIKLKATTPNGTFYSNYFVCYENKLTLLLDYKFNDYYQSIRVQGYFTNLENENAVDNYTESQGLRLSGYSTLTNKYNYKIDYIDNFTFLAFNQALRNPEVYINGIRITDKPLLKPSGIEGQSNFMASELQGAVNIFDTYEHGLQIAPRLDLLDATPQGLYTLASFSNNFILTFNHNIEINNDLPIMLYKDNVEIEILNVEQTNGNIVEFVTPEFTFVNGIYKWIIPAGKFINNIFGSHLEIIINFVIQDADYDENDYDENDYFTN